MLLWPAGPVEYLGFSSPLSSVASEALRESQAWAGIDPSGGGSLKKIPSLLWSLVLYQMTESTVTISLQWSLGYVHEGPTPPGKGHSHVPKMLLRKRRLEMNHHILLPTLAAKAAGSSLLSMGPWRQIVPKPQPARVSPGKPNLSSLGTVPTSES